MKLNMKQKLQVVMYATALVGNIYNRCNPEDFRIRRLCNLGHNLLNGEDVSVYVIASVTREAVDAFLQCTSESEAEITNTVIENVNVIDVTLCNIKNYMMGITPIDLYSDTYNQLIDTCILRCVNAGADTEMIESYAVKLDSRVKA